jgi:acetyl esterase
MSAEPFADQELADFIRGLADLPPMTAGGDAVEMRRITEERSANRPPGPAMAMHDLSLGGGVLPCRLYQPDGALDALIILFHGGGWTIGSLETHDRVCRLLADRAAVPVLAVEYRLAPEYPAPAAIDDAVTALETAAEAVGPFGVRPEVIAIVGDSAGGTLAASAALRTRQRDVAPDLVGLIYANTNLTADDGSMISNGHGFGLEREDIEWFHEQWVPDRSCWSDPEVSPLLVDDLSGFPETIIVTCELDPLRDQGEAFGNRLSAAGVNVTVRREPGMVHNFLLWDLISPACAAAADRVADDIRRAIETMVGSAAP